MAEIAAGFVGPAIEVVKWIGAPIMRRFNYLCCFTSNITTLKLEAEKLDDAEGDLQGKVDRARDNVEIVAREVEAWLAESNDIKDIKNTILDEVPNVESGCLKLGTRFSLSKRAKKTIDRIIELRDQYCKFDVVSQPRPRAAAEAVPLGMTTYEFKSRKQIEEDIMTSLRGGDVNMIGIYGMGGLGKTTMAKIIMNRALKEHLFDEVVMVVVSQQVDKSKIQLEIGGSLGLDLKDETAEASRVQKLHARLTEGKKRILVVLDDVWQRLVFEDLGTPRGYKGCTILLTSRNSDVLRAMDVQKDFGMKVLSEEDAWLLFRGRAGACVDDTGLNSIAKEVVEECRGLPIALATVGAALKDENDMRIWKDAVTQLRKASPNNIPYFIKEVYSPLKVSYDGLESREARSVFLLCCLFHEDADIPVEKLTYLCMGLDIFERAINNLEEARNSIRLLIKRLKSRSLLLDGHNEDHVIMHDVVRDVCIFIAKQEGYIGGNDCTWISSFLTTIGERTKLPTKLRLLFLSGNYSELEQEINKFSNSFVEGIRDLQVLFIENYSSLTSLPHTIESLRNLRTLVLCSCEELETISVVGELVHLEILVCRNCDSIKELPPEMKRLNRLKLLDLTRCRNLERIGRGIISSLVRLEELKMLGSFKKWEAARDSSERENGNAAVRELEGLTNLRCLEIEIDDPALAAENMRLSSKLERFKIRIASDQDLCQRLEFLPYSFNKTMSLKLEGGTRVGDWIEIQLLRDTECLQLTGNGANNVDYMAKCQNIRWLSLGECETMKNIGRTSMDDATVFPFLEYLELCSLGVLEEILDGPISSHSFYNLNELQLEDLPALKQLWKSSSIPVFYKLSSIKIRRCPRLRNLGQLSIAGHDGLSQLQTLVISDCEMMEQVILLNEEEWGITITFPKLKEVELYNLPNLATFYQGIEGIEFPLLMTMRMEECPKLMKSMISSKENSPGGSSNAGIDDDYPSHLFCQPQELELSDLRKLVRFCEWKGDVELPSLSQVVIVKCPKMTNLTSGQGMSAIEQLQILHIEECEMMEQVFLCNEEDNQRNIETTLAFSELTSLSLKSLPKLTSLCKGIESFEFPQLTQIQVNDCPLLKDKIFSMNFFFEPDKVNMEIWNNQPFRNAEYLSLEGNAYGNLDVREVQNMCWLTFRECSRGTKLVNVTTMDTLFPQLEVLRLVKLPELEEIWEIDGPIQSNSFKNLKELRLEFLPALKHLWQSNSSSSQMNVVSIFSKLSSLYIYGCHQLYSLFSLPVTETDSCLLQLKKLVMESCDRMEHIFFWNEGENKSNIHIPKLKVLILDSLPKLTCFCRGIKSFEFPSLDQKRISRCPLLENFVSTDNHDDDYMHIFCKPDYNKVEQKMELKLQGNITLGRNRIHHCFEYMSLEGESSTSLDFVVAQSIRCLTFGEFSMGTKLMNMTIIATLFPLLKVLSLVKITELEEIWDIDGHGPKNINELRLKSLPALKHLWQSSSSPSQMNAVSIFSKLSSIYIHGCHELCNLFSLPVTDTGSCVLQLENLVIESCEMMEHVFLWNGKESQRSIVFPKLKVLKLDSLLSLTSFCEGMESFEFPLLVEMRISGCPLLRNLVFTESPTESPTDDDDGKPDKKKIELLMNQLFRKVTYLSLEGDIYRSLDLKLADQNMLSFKELLTEMKLLNVTTIDTLFPHLEILRLVKLTELVDIWEFDGPMPSTSFKNLKELRLEFLQAPKHLWLSSNSPYQMNVISIFNQLSSIYIYGCDGLCNLFSLSMMPRGSCLLQLERLEIEGCNEMNQVFLWNEEKNIHVEKFPKLKFLSLSFLPKLRNICKGIERIQCPLLDKMKIINCPLLQSIVYWDQELPFIFNSLRSSQPERGKGANTALQPQMLKREEKQQQKEVGEQSNLIRKTTTEDEDEEGRKGEIEEEQNWKTTTEKEEGRKVEIEEEQNWKTTAKGGRKCEIEEEQN